MSNIQGKKENCTKLDFLNIQKIGSFVELNVQSNTFQLSILKGNFPVAIY